MSLNDLILSTDDVFCNRRGYLRVSLVRKFYGLHYLDDTKVLIQTQKLKQIDLKEITRLYTNWRDFNEYIPLRFKYKTSGFIDFKDTPICPDKWIDRYMENVGLFATRFNDVSNIVCYEHYKNEWKHIKASKRGNDVYVNLVKEKLKPLLTSGQHKQFFSIKLNSKRKRIRKTKLLYLTGTCDSSKTGDMSRSWLKFGEYWNKFITNIRGQFGKTVYMRAWQSQENGYPHYHALLYFYDKDFTATKWIDADGKKSWRIHNKQKLHKGDTKTIRERFKDAWKYGHLDIKCCDDSKKALRDLQKYIIRDLEGGESNLTNAMVWYFGKQSYSISKGFKELFNVDIASDEPSDDDLINASGVIQSSNSNYELVEIGIFPMISDEIFNKNRKVIAQSTIYECEKPPPADELNIKLLDDLADACKEVSSRRREDGVRVVVFDWREVV